MMELPLFDRAESIRHRDAGVAVAAENSAAVLVRVKAIACEIGRRQVFVTADDVQREMAVRGISSKALGNGAGSMFRGTEWRFTGRYEASVRIASHGRMIRVWEYVGGNSPQRRRDTE